MNINITFNKSIIFLFFSHNVPYVLDLMLFVFNFNKIGIQNKTTIISLDAVSRGNILKTSGMLCNPKFICKNNWYLGLSPTYFLYPLASLPKMVKQEMPASIEQS